MCKNGATTVCLCKSQHFLFAFLRHNSSFSTYIKEPLEPIIEQQIAETACSANSWRTHHPGKSRVNSPESNLKPHKRRQRGRTCSVPSACGEWCSWSFEVHLPGTRPSAFRMARYLRCLSRSTRQLKSNTFKNSPGVSFLDLTSGFNRLAVVRSISSVLLRASALYQQAQQAPAADRRCVAISFSALSAGGAWPAGCRSSRPAPLAAWPRPAARPSNANRAALRELTVGVTRSKHPPPHQPRPRPAAELAQIAK